MLKPNTLPATCFLFLSYGVSYRPLVGIANIQSQVATRLGDPVQAVWFDVSLQHRRHHHIHDMR
jgi:hypothetical protein